MNYREQPVLFSCNGEDLVGIATMPVQPRAIGLLIIVGGPQYRVGSHRQFLLLARQVAEAGFSAFRFDHRGAGDSSGEMRTFEQIDDDLAAACSAFRRTCPGLESIVLWGLCDGASAAMMACNRLPGIRGVVALNPWVRTETSFNQTLLRHYYLKRLFDREFWAKLASGRLGVVPSLQELCRRAKGALGTAMSESRPEGADHDFRYRMLRELEKFNCPVLLVLSGRDLTAREFETFTTQDAGWASAIAGPLVTMKAFPKADHTFSSAEMRAAVARVTSDYLARIAT